jgi:SpoVK/Ycf46/Vps4 family AAA+-type ATPase
MANAKQNNGTTMSTLTEVERQQKEPTVGDIVQRAIKALQAEANFANGLKRGGDSIILPEKMGIPDAIRALERVQHMAEQVEEIHTTIDCVPQDGLVAAKRAIDETFGALLARPGMVETLFGMRKVKPTIVSIQIDLDEKLEVPFGFVEIPGFDMGLEIEYHHGNGPRRPPTGLHIKSECKRLFHPIFRQIEQAIRRYLRTNSIYRGKAVADDFTFIDLRRFDVNRVIYPRVVEAAVETYILTPLKKTKECLENKVSLKRGVLMYGNYGTGKTLTALMTAKIATENGWTFFNVRPGQNFVDTLTAARQYEPAVVFVEDIDASTGGEREAGLNEILETFDGTVTKDSQIMVIVTTNHVEKINRAMLRPGRLDSIIEMVPFDEPAVERFIRQHTLDASGNSLIEGELDTTALYEAARDYVPAFLAEAVGRAKMVAMGRRDVIDGVIKVTSDDIIDALEGMRPQWQLMQTPQVVRTTTIDDLVKRAVEGVANGHDN